jgi:hypothetical protein
MISASRICLLAAFALIGGSLAACGEENTQTADAGGDSAGSTASGSSSEASTQIVGGRSVLKLDPRLQKVLDAARVKIAPAAEASRSGDGIALPITAGQLDIDTPSGTVQHAGAIEFRAFGRSVRADNLVLRPQDGVVTARIDGERVRLFSANVGQPEVVETSDTVVMPADVSMGDGAVGALNDALGAKIFDSGLHVGRLTVSAKQPQG